MSSPMHSLGRNWYWAGDGFTHRGLWRWTGRRNLRIIPFNKFFEWHGPKKEDT